MRCLQKEMETYRHWSVSLRRDSDELSHIVESCSLTKLNDGLPWLHSADEDTVSSLTNYGSWHAYEEKKKKTAIATTPVGRAFKLFAPKHLPRHVLYGELLREQCTLGRLNSTSKTTSAMSSDNIISNSLTSNTGGTKIYHRVSLLLLVCVSFTIIGQPRNSVLIRRV